jgi:16S rRNA (guanine527-N7)-methyltransferase
VKRSKRLAGSFHVKQKTHRADSPSPLKEPSEAIAVATRERVARWLGATALHPRDGFLERIEEMAATLVLWGARTNLTAEAADAGEIAFHVIDSLAPIALATGAARATLEAALSLNASVLDLGSGAGFPGLVLAAAFDARFSLAESRRKRASYLQVAAHAMDLRNVAVEQRRASPRSFANGFDLVTARAFGLTAELYETASTALRDGGVLLLYASADQVLAVSRARPQQLLAEDATWNYRLSHREREVARTAILWRKKPSPLRSLKRR